MLRALSALFMMSQYFFNGSLMDWSEAYVQCQSSGGQLVVFDTPGEADILRQLIEKYNVSSIHVGFHDKFLEGHYTTILGAPVSASDGLWALGSPRGNSTYNCGGFTVAGITDIDCKAKQPSICELRHLYGYDLIPGMGYYNHHTEDLTWPQAWAACKSEGAHLVVLNSLAELEALYRRYAVSTFWVGLHQLHANNTFVTVLDQPVGKTGYDSWYTSWPWARPVNVSRPYVAVHGNRGMMAHDCSVLYEFVCEHELI